MKQGVRVVMRAIEEPLRRIACNAGYEGSVVIDKVKNSEGANGYNADTDTYEDLIKAGVIDPTKVVRYALQNAGSVASLMLTTEAMIAEKPEEKAADRMPGAGRRHGRHGRYGRYGRHDVITPSQPAYAKIIKPPQVSRAGAFCFPLLPWLLLTTHH
jgi:chaperonin GroEL